MRFDEFDLNDDILDALDEMNFTDCTPVQEGAIGHILDGNDVIAVAQTGTGKTAAYLLPVLSLLGDIQRRGDGIRCIVMVPTHELAKQIDSRLAGFSYYTDISSLAIHGGSDGVEFARQQRGLRMGADIVTATPGRLLAHLKMGKIKLDDVEFFILDEADRMLDMGFYEDIMQIVRQLPTDRQTLLFSATMPSKIQQLASSILINPVEVKIAVSRPTDKIAQSAVICYEKQKFDILCNYINRGFNEKVIVFASSKLKVRELTQQIRSRGWKAGEMHSDLDQSKREEAMFNFSSGRTSILIATDIVARGIDIDDIKMVVNYDVPREAEDYIHRIGRTARANADGKAVTFVNEKDQVKFGRIERFLGYEVIKEVVPEELGEVPPYQPNPVKGKFRGKRKSSVYRNNNSNNKQSNKKRYYHRPKKD
ncbi:MAG: DEAD/DEAH box helicase [Muribaculaceae bacterium]|nr:DEAD/DEAH box helicase [Muribaculaceae bacterium]